MKDKGLTVLNDAPSAAAGPSCGTGGLTTQMGSSPTPSIFADSEFQGNVLMVTLGCAKNLVDSELMLGALRSRGFRPIAEPEQADLIVVNTCAFLQSAVEEGIDRILELAKLKETGRCRRLVVAGCMVERYRADLEKSLPEVDRFISTDELLQVADEGSTSEDTFRQARRPYFLYDETMPRLRSTAGHTAYVKISEGCDRPCAFCIIPKIRGEFRSRPVASVLREVQDLVQDGVREINLVAQDLTAYGSDLLKGQGGANGKLGKTLLPELLESFDRFATESDREYWVRLLYAYPIGVNQQLLDAIRNSKTICDYLDLPLQHIANSVLKRMNRPLGERGTRGLIEQIRSYAPEIALRTTFIVGFPGETEEDIRSLESFVREGHFTNLGVFPYSQESEAKSYTFDEQVPEELRVERRNRIMECQQAVVAERAESLIGSRVQVLVEGFHQDSDLLLTGRAVWQAPETDGEVIINEVDEDLLQEVGEGREDFSVESFLGRFGEVEITEAVGYDLVGTLKLSR